MEWVSVEDSKPPKGEWLEFYDGDRTMGHYEPFNHIDKLNNRGESLVNYLHNYTHWRFLDHPEYQPTLKRE